MNKLFLKSLPLICVLTQFISMLLFAFSFFNAEEVLLNKSADNNDLKDGKTLDFLQNDNKYKEIDNYCRKQLSQSRAKPMFNKMVLIVIDALRHDFIPSIDHKKSVRSGRVEPRMPFTEKIMKTHGIGLVSISATPTVTMPRIKAMISGTLPSFMDYILNLSAYKFKGENLVENAFKANKRIVFFGDDTWIHLLPKNLFHRHNGTSSFFATDYTEVDTNVTYCIDRELKRLHDWDLMIAHYLGVDHIGHSHGGYHSRLMPKKLLEMDRVVESVYKSVSAPDVSEPYLIVITGDHGMTDVGNHGGNTIEETDTALVFITTNETKTSDPKKSKISAKNAERVLQVDISSTLSALLGLPLPNKSRGKVMLNVLNALNMSKEEQMCHMFANALQISSLVNELSTKERTLIENGFKYHQNLIERRNTREFDFKRAADSYNSFIDSLQLKLLTKFTEKSLFSLLTLSLVFAVLPIVGFLFLECRNRHSIIFIRLNDIQSVFAVTALSLNCLFLLSTSFMETQHYFWYYMTSTFVLIYLTIAVRNYYRFEHQSIASLVDPFASLRESYGLIRVVAIILVLVLLRVSNYWNVLYNYDIGQWLNTPDNKRVLSAIVICSLIAISYLMSTKRFGKQQCLLISGLVWVYLYRSDCGTVSSFKIPYFLYVERNIRAKIVFFHVYLIIIESFLKRLRKYFNLKIAFLDFLQTEESTAADQPVTSITLRTVCTIWVLLSALFFKVHNIPLLAINIVLEKLVNYAINGREDRYKLHLAVTYLCFAESAFYSAGNSNTLSTLDVSPAFIGLDSYQPFFATIFMVINVYSLYVYWILMFFIRIKDCKSMSAIYKTSSVVNLLLTTRFATVLVDMLVTIVLQNHLFIWSVLCPKFLYESALTLVNEMIVLFVIFNNFID